jgi:hypothetical protein
MSIIEHSSRKVHGALIVSPKITGLCIAISIPHNKLSGMAFDNLCCFSPSCTMEHINESAIAAALVQEVQSRLMGSAFEMVKTRVIDVQGSIAGDCLNIYICASHSNLSVAKKILGIACAALAPSKMFKRYKTIMRAQKIPAKKEVFEHGAKSFDSALSHVDVTVVGKIKDDTKTRQKFNEVITFANSKLSPEAVGGRGEPLDYTRDVECNHDEIDRPNNFAAVLTHDLVEKAAGVHMCVDGKKFYFNENLKALILKTGKEETMQRVIARMDRLPDLHVVLAQRAIVAGILSASEISKSFKSHSSLNSLSSTVSRALQ